MKMMTDYDILPGTQLNFIDGNGTINATQVININIADYISTLQKRLLLVKNSLSNSIVNALVLMLMR